MVKTIVKTAQEQNKWETLFDQFLDLTEFSLCKDKDGWWVEDHAGANLGDIESDRFDTAEQIFERMSIYIDDYIDEDLCNVWVDELEHNPSEIPSTLEGWLDHREELKEYSFELDLIDMICNHYGEINLENCTHDIEEDVATYNYFHNEETNELTIYENDRVLATISDVEEEQADEMFKEIVFELREIKL